MYPTPICNNQLKYNTNVDSKPIFFTSVPSSQPKAIIIERMGCDYHLNQNEENNKPSSPLSSLELAVELARRDVQDEMSRNLIQKLQLVNKKSENSMSRTSNEKQNDKSNKMVISNNNKIYNTSNILYVPSSSPSTKDRVTFNKIQNITSIQKSQISVSSNRSLKKLISEIEQMSKEIYMCFNNISKILTFKLKATGYLDQYEIERISSRVGDRHIRINRCIYSLNTDLSFIFSHFEKEINLILKRQILNLCCQCFRNQLRVLRLLLQQINDWLKFGKLYIQTLNLNINEHLSKLIYIFCHSLDMCMQLQVFEDAKLIHGYIDDLTKLSTDQFFVHQSENEVVNKETKFISKFQLGSKNIISKIDEPRIHNAQNGSLNQEIVINQNNDNIMRNFNDDLINISENNILEKNESKGDYLGRNNVFLTKPKKKLYGGYRKRKLNLQKSKKLFKFKWTNSSSAPTIKQK